MSTRCIVGSVLVLGVLAGGAVLLPRMGPQDTSANDTARMARAEGVKITHDDRLLNEKPRIIMDERDTVHENALSSPLGLSNREGFQSNGGNFQTTIKTSKSDWMTRFDADGDGTLNDAERLASKQALRAEREARKQQWLLEKYDTDGDGVLNAEEEAQIEADRIERETKRAEREEERKKVALEAYDTDRDGMLSDEEKQAGRVALQEYMTKQHEAMQSMLDTDGDGQVTSDERTTMRETMDKFFDEMKVVRAFDSDGDHAITATDLPAYMDMFLAGNPLADLNNDRVVNEADLFNFQERTLTPPNPRMTQALAWFNDAPPPVDGGLGNIMMFGGGQNMMFMEGQNLVLHAAGGEKMSINGTVTIKTDLHGLKLNDENAIVIIETTESTKND